MKKLLPLVLLSAALGLAGCQTTGTSASSVNPEMTPPATMNTQSQAPAPANTASNAAAAQSQAQSQVVITLHLAQEKSEPELIPIDLGSGALYALPQPILTQGDMRRVTPVNAPDQQTFLLIELTEAGAKRIQTVTSQAQGHYFLLSVRGQLVSVSQIGETVEDGRLMVSMQSPQQAQQVLQMMRGS